MRDFIVWDIINRIENSPNEYIGQRCVSLLDAFLFGYEIHLEIHNKKQFQEKYSELPSIDEYIRKKYQVEDIGSRSARSIISFTCEDEREYFYSYMAHLREYEKLFPTDETIHYSVKENPAFELKELLAGIRKRYPMYFGYYNFACLRAFFDGYFCCKKEFNLELTETEKGINTFISQISCETLSLTGKFVTWDRKYRMDRNWTAWGETGELQEKSILEDFWIDLEQIINNKIELSPSVK